MIPYYEYVGISHLLASGDCFGDVVAMLEKMHFYSYYLKDLLLQILVLLLATIAVAVDDALQQLPEHY